MSNKQGVVMAIVACVMSFLIGVFCMYGYRNLEYIDTIEGYENLTDSYRDKLDSMYNVYNDCRKKLLDCTIKQ